MTWRRWVAVNIVLSVGISILGVVSLVTNAAVYQWLKRHARLNLLSE